MARLTLDEALVWLRDLGEGAGLVSARWLVEVRLDPDAEARLGEPARGCNCRRHEVTPRRLQWEQGCVCAQTTLALRLWELAFPGVQPGLATDARKRRYRRKCPACRVPFVTGERGVLYCGPCTTRRQDEAT